MKKTFVEQLSVYHSFHTLPITRATHYIGVPLLLFAALIFLGWIHISVPNLFDINLAWIGVLGLLIYYYLIDVISALGMTVILIILTFLANLVSQPAITATGAIIFFVILILGVISQLIGHLLEKKKPAFTENLLQVFIAPLYLYLEVLFKFGFRKELEAEIVRRSQGNNSI